MSSFNAGRKLLRVSSLETEEDRLREEYGGKNWARSWSEPFQLLPTIVKDQYAEALTETKHSPRPEEEPANDVCYLKLEDSLQRVLQSTPIFSPPKSDGSSDKASSLNSGTPNDFLCIPAEKSLYSSVFIDEEEVAKPTTESKEVQCSLPEKKSAFSACVPFFGMLFFFSLICNAYLFATI